MICDYCGQDHPLDALCRPRLAVSRRRFLFLGMSAAAAAMLPPLPLPLATSNPLTPYTVAGSGIISIANFDEMLKAIWLPKLVEGLNRPSPVLRLSDLQQRP